VTIENNKIYKNKKDGISLKLLALSSLLLSKNNIVSNGGTGIWLNSVH